MWSLWRCEREFNFTSTWFLIYLAIIFLTPNSATIKVTRTTALHSVFQIVSTTITLGRSRMTNLSKEKNNARWKAMRYGKNLQFGFSNKWFHYDWNIKAKFSIDLTFLSGKPKIPDSLGNTIKKLLLCFKWKTLRCVNRLHYPFWFNEFDWSVQVCSCMTQRSNVAT